MGEVGNLVGQAFGGDSKANVDALAQRRSQFLDTYGQSDDIKGWINDKDFKPQYEAIDASKFGEYGADPTNKATLQRINTARAKWSDLSDSERAIATEETKQFNLEFEKRNKENDALKQVNRIMDQRELASKNAGSRPSPGGSPIMTGGSSIFGTPSAGGAKTLLGT